MEIKKSNIGVGGRIARAAAALVLGALIVFKVVTGGWAIALGVVAGLMILVSLIGVCPAIPSLKKETK